MNEHELLVEKFETHRSHLRSVAYRMLGSVSEAEDAVQESWLHLSRSDTSEVENLGGWLTTVVARVCLDMLRSRNSRREEPLEEYTPDLGEDETDPEHEVLLAESVGLALSVVLDTLSPAERLAFVLHDIFAVPFVEIAQIVGRSPTATRQLASRARRRVQSADTVADTDNVRQREVVSAFFAASRNGNFAALVAMLDPDVALRADPVAVQMGATKELLGAGDVAKRFSGAARVARLALINGVAGAVWTSAGQPRVVFSFTLINGKIVEINLLADSARLAQLEVVILKSE